ncbi:LLM class flavin-dependent oxidoreductase [Deinococcus deserti]|uniref:Putative alkanal monooxygenase (FMN-linked) (Aldehyde monooxygenase) (Bacterial luciferase) n=1 Tax=Deinococcus deserti (strain DSM 17065 / CIP 109153 / LMG 22923 / VCD115) TaxID=546414 RepID=C1CUW1_DEIDV|nr:LLM class flavin-dependent oxidoreductase [Deinococcus deserti]ACO45978.1 putative alkanal monooxygenase (FMN-linked) (aldehyde monooxygenase) (bacterial luciferase) [Deinococcus deserti VCD115]
MLTDRGSIPAPAPSRGHRFELGLYTFAERTPDPYTGQLVSPAQRLQDLLEEIVLADQVGLDVFGIGEHHRPEFVVSSPAVVLAAAAARTRSIRLTSAVTVLSSDDPVRVFQDFATLDLLSQGRAEIMAGRGSFIESFPLFGYDLHDYDALFAEKLDLLLKLRQAERVTWTGRYRPAITDLGVYPRPLNTLPVWLAVGGTPQSAVRAGTLGLPLAVAIIGGMPERFAPLISLYRTAAQRTGFEPSGLPVGINSHGYIAPTSQQAADESFPYHQHLMNTIGRERGWPPFTREQFDASLDLRGALVVGDPQQVAEKILFQHGIFGHQRFLLQLSVRTMPHAQIMRAIELLGTQVAPVVREEVRRRTSPGSAPSEARSE